MMKVVTYEKNSVSIYNNFSGLLMGITVHGTQETELMARCSVLISL